MTSIQSRSLGLAAVLLLAGSTAAAQVAIDCQTIQERAPASGLTANPKAVATVPRDKQAQGYVRVGGGCEVSRFGFDSVNAEVMVQNAPDGESGWRCKGADPALISNPAWARASVTFCRARDPGVSSLRLQCTTLSKKTGPAHNPAAEVTLSKALVDDGYTVVSGGCDSSHFGNGSTHAENVVVSKPSPNGQGWSCQAADPPNHLQDATVEASLVACRVAVDPAQAAALNPKPALRCAVSPGAKSAVGTYPKSTATAAGYVWGGGCELSHAGAGSVHAEFMVQQGPRDGVWSCLAADPPGIPNPGTAQASAVACSITTAPAPPPAPLARKNPVIIVGGTMAGEILYWLLEGRLRADGYTTEFFELPGLGMIDIHASAQQLKYKVADVLLRTGAEKVNLIGHSQGGITARTYVHDFGPHSVESLITLGSPHQGINIPKGSLLELLSTTLFSCTANPPPPICSQLLAGAPLIQQINQRAPDDAIFYTSILTTNDVFVVPYTFGLLSTCDRRNASGELLKCNVVVQDKCKSNLVDHIGLSSNGVVYSGVRQALAHQQLDLDCLAL